MLKFLLAALNLTCSVATLGIHASSLPLPFIPPTSFSPCLSSPSSFFFHSLYKFMCAPYLYALGSKNEKAGRTNWSKSKSFKIFNIEFSLWQWFEGVLNLQLPWQLKMHIRIDLYYTYVVKGQSPLLKFCCLSIIIILSYSVVRSSFLCCSSCFPKNCYVQGSFYKCLSAHILCLCKIHSFCGRQL